MAWLLPPLPPTFEAALRDVRARRPESRMAAAERLANASESERGVALEGLRSLAKDAHPSVRATALSALGTLGAGTDLDLLLDALDDPASEVREIAAFAASKIGGERVVAHLRKALESPHPELRFQAVASLTELIPDEAPGLIVALLSDSDPEVRGQVVTALASLSAPHLAGHLARALEDASAEVQLEAALALSAHGDLRGEDVLLSALPARHRLPEVAAALASLGCLRARAPLARIGANLWAGPHARACAGAALVRLGDPQGAVILRRVLRAFSSLARSYAVELVKDAHALELVDELLRFVDRPRGVDLLTLVDALASFAGESSQAHAGLTHLSRRPGEVGTSARIALAQLEAKHHG